MLLTIYAVLAYVSIPYMTGEHGVYWMMMMIVPGLCEHIFISLYMYDVFCCIYGIYDASSEIPSGHVPPKK